MTASTKKKLFHVLNVMRFLNSLPVYTGRQLDPDHREFTSKVESSLEDLIKENVKLSWTPKIHHIIHHFSDYFEDTLVEKKISF